MLAAWHGVLTLASEPADDLDVPNRSILKVLRGHERFLARAEHAPIVRYLRFTPSGAPPSDLSPPPGGPVNMLRRALLPAARPSRMQWL